MWTMIQSFSPGAFGIALALFCHFTMCAGADRLEHKPATSSRFRFESRGGTSLGLWEGDRPVFVYNYGDIGSPSTPDVPKHSAYLHPIYGLDGEVLTDDFPKDHVYHR